MERLGGGRNYKYYDLILGGFVCVLLCSNLIGASKIASVWGVQFSSGVLFFPISYIFGDVLTEVYGYAHSRKVVWAGFGAMAFASLMSAFVVNIPPAEGWPHQAAYEAVFGGTYRIFLGSLIAFFCGEFANSYTLAKMKIWSNGKRLWIRTIGSTVVGEAVDTLIFYPIAFLGLWPLETVFTVLFHNYLMKVGVEVVMTPVTYRIVAFLKRAENEDYYDRDTHFTPFSLKT